MAEYAGLEIRIGGNTTKLTSALKASTKSAAELQSRIRQITRAMQFDPTDLKNIDTRIKITGDRMQSLQSKAKLVSTAMQQLGDSTVKLGGKDKTIRAIASETQNLSLKAKQADERFNGLTGSLAKIYESWNRLSRSNGVDYLTDTMGFTQDEAERLMRSTTSLRDFVSLLKEEQELRRSPLYTGDRGLISDADIEKVRQLKELNFHDMFKRGLELDDVLKEAEKFGVVIEESAVENVRELQKAFKGAQQDKKAFDDALRFEQLGTDLQRINSEAESLSQTMRKLDDSLNLTTRTDEFQAIESDVRSVDAALDNVERDLERTGEAMKLDPGNLQVAARYFGDLQQKASLSEEKMSLLKREMEMLDANGASDAAKSHEDLAKWIEESAEAARLAQKDLSNQRAEVANLEDQVKTYKQAIATMKGDATVAEFSDNVIKWKKATESLSKEMGDLETAEKKVAEQQERLAKAKASFDDATKEADGYKRKLDELTDEYNRLTDAFNNADKSADFAGMIQEIGRLETEMADVESAYKGATTNVSEFSRKLEAQQEYANLAEASLQTHRDEVERLSTSIKELEKTSEVKLFKSPTTEIDKAEGELAGLRNELGRATVDEKRLASAYKAAETENELAKSANALRGLQQEANETEAELKSVTDELSTKGSGILNPSTIKSIGMTLSATLTPAILGIGYKMVDASSTVDSAYRDMRKTVEGTEEQFEHLRQAAIEFSRTHVTSADQILQIEAIGGELGIATENLETFAEVISNIDVATNLDTESAAEALGHLSNILHLTEDDYVGFSDALVRLGNNGASTETEIANIAERIGSMGAIVGMSGSDVLAWASSLASTGQNAEAAATALSKTMSFMETAVAAAGGTIDTSFEAISAAVQEGGDKLTIFANLSGMTADEFAESWETNSEDMAATLNESLGKAKENLQMVADVAHMSADEFAKTWEKDPTKALESFIKGLNSVEEAEGSADKVLQSLGITAVRQKQGIEGLMQTIEGLDNNLKMSKDAWNGISDEWGQAGDAANEAAKKAEGFSGQMQILKNMGQNFLSELGEGAVPWIKALASDLEWATAAFSGLSAESKKWIVAAGGIVALAGPMLSFFGTFSTAAGEAKEWLDTTMSGMNLIKLAAKYSSKELDAALTGTVTTMGKVKLVAADLGAGLLKGLAVGAVVAGIATITYALYQLYERYKEHVAATKGLTDAISNIGVASDDAVEGIGGVTKSLGDLLFEAGGYESRLAELARTIEDSNSKYGALAGSLDHYSGIIEELGGKADLTEDEAYRLQAALLAVNDACGTTYGLSEYGEIIDTQTGKVVNNTDALKDNIEARKQQALIDYYADDYAQATEQWAAAQDNLNNLLAEQKQLTGEGGKEAWIDNYIEKVGRADLAEDAYNQVVRQTQIQLANAQTEVQRTEEAMGILESKIGAAKDELDKFNSAAEEAEKAQEELAHRTSVVSEDVTGNMKRMSDAAEKLGTSDAGFNTIVDSLEAIHVAADEMNDVDMSRLVSSFGDAGSSMADVISALEDGGAHLDTWNAALEQAPGAAENMASVTTAAFDAMYEVANQDLNDTMTLIAGLDQVKVGDKTFYIGDNGSIVDAEGKIYSLKDDLADIPDEVITAYYVDDAEALKKTQEAKSQLRDVGKQNPTPKIGVKDNATKPTETLQSKLTTLAGMKPTPSAYLNDYASGTINGIAARLRSLNGSSATVYVNEKTVKQATGGLNNRPVIPRHAIGYIATGPTLTNQGWIGEDGIEAVANWATGGAVVPLSNKRYMLPIADAIADGMARRGGGVERGPINVYVTCEGDPNEVAGAIVRALELNDV